MLLVELASIVLAILLLWKGADWVVESAADVAQRAGLSELVVGMTIVALGTSAPEIVVTLSAALRGNHDISMGNVIGSNICNTGLILGICAASYTVPTSRDSVYRDLPVLLIAVFLLCLFVLDSTLSIAEGLAMIVGLGVYVVYMIRSDAGDAEANFEPVDHPHPSQTAKASTWLLTLRLTLGLAAVLGGGWLLVEAAVRLARGAGISEWAVGVTVVAAGTSLPELATALVASARGHSNLMIGNLIGSDIFNVLGVLGLSAVASGGLGVAPAASTGVAMMLLMLGVLGIFMRTGWRLSRLEGLALFAFALLRWGRDLAPNMW